MMLFNLCGATSPQMRLWETHAMMITPMDYWRAGVDLWFKTAETQIETGFRVMAAIQGWDVALQSARSLKSDAVTLKAAPAAEPKRKATTPVRKRAAATASPVKPAPAAPSKTVDAADAPKTAARQTETKAKSTARAPAPAKASVAAKPSAAPQTAPKTGVAAKAAETPAEQPAAQASQGAAPAKAANQSAAPASRRRRAPSVPPMPAALSEGGGGE